MSRTEMTPLATGDVILPKRHTDWLFAENAGCKSGLHAEFRWDGGRVLFLAAD
jgi:hypothetical protein